MLLSCKGLVAHRDIIKIYRTITFKHFYNILKLLLKYFKINVFQNENQNLCKKRGYL